MKFRARISVLQAFAMTILGVLHAGQGAAEERIERLHWEEATAIKIPVSDDLVELGHRTYETRCIICHGKEGKGDGLASAYLETKPRNFTSGIFKYRTTPQASFPLDLDIFRAITVGFPIYGMPSFQYLSARERWGLVYYVKQLTENGFRKNLEEDGSLEPGEIDEITDDILKPDKPLVVGEGPEWTDAAVAEGRQIYAELECARCHGETGMGDGPSAEDLKDDWGNAIQPVPFALNRYYMKAGGRPRDIVRVLKTGVGGTPMPMYDGRGEEDYWKLAYYVLELHRKSAEMDK